MYQIHSNTGITVVIVKRPQDWQRIEQSRQYHIPIRHVMRILQASWFAFYVPGWHTTQPHCIRHVARMTAMTITPRHVYLPDEPTNPRTNHLYAILTFDTIYTLREPIISTRWRRINIHHTTWGVLARTFDLGALSHMTRRMQTTPHVDNDELLDLLAPDESQ